jgi:BirA family biotin operon repressor/biotin-[acetyl-CoA-carboxylase] ligase
MQLPQPPFEHPVELLLDECDSTNTVAKLLAAAGAPQGSWVSASRQTQGRGRQGRSWESLSGNLLLSLVVREVPKSLWTWAPLATALGTAQAIKDLYPQIPHLQIKWPNDLLLGGKKACGILCESESSGALILGIGVNRAQAPELPEVTALELSEVQAKASVSVETLRKAVIQKVLKTLKVLSQEGPSPLEHAYHSQAYLPEGCPLRWQTSEGVFREGVAAGLGPQGELLVRMASTGKIQRLFAEDVHRVRPEKKEEAPKIGKILGLLEEVVGTAPQLKRKSSLPF